MKNNRLKGLLFCGIMCLMLLLSAGFMMAPKSAEVAFANGSSNAIDISQLKFSLINNDTEYRVSALDKKIVEAIIPAEYKEKPVTEIAANGFMLCTKLTMVEIPETVTKIGNAAFSDCENLREVFFITNGSKGVREIGMDAFAYCDIENIIIPNTVETIGKYAFDGCPDESEIIVRKEESEVSYKSVFNTYSGIVTYDINHLVLNKVAGQNAYRISNYQNIVESNGILTIPFHNKGNCDSNGIADPTLDDGYPIVEIGRRAFVNCELDVLEIGTCIECSEHKINIVRQAFYNSKISSIILNNNVIIEEDADGIFAGSAVKYVSLPKDITHIPFSTFIGCEQLTTIATTETQINHLPDTLVNIGDDAFSGCTSLNYLFIPKSIELSGSNIGIYIFESWEGHQVVEFELTHAPEAWTGINWNGGNAEIEWQPLTIKFDANHNEANPYNFSAKIKYNQTLTDIPYIPQPTCDRFEFTGWYTQDGVLVNSTEELKNDQTLYAGWKAKKPKITFEENDYVVFNYTGGSVVDFNSCRRSLSWVVEGITTYYDNHFSEYGMIEKNYLVNNTWKEIFKYWKQFISYLGRDINWETDRFLFYDFVAFYEGYTDPSQGTHWTNASFFGYLVANYGDEAAIKSILSESGNYKNLDKTFTVLYREWKAYLDEKFAGYTKEQ